MSDIRECTQCGALFTPRREHARFCSAKCRVAWNRHSIGNPGAAEGVLDWSITAMTETTDRLLRASGGNRPRAYEVITEAVWWCTMVDATLMRYHPDARSAALAARGIAERQAIEDTFAGLRFLRNRLGYRADPDDFIQPGQSAPADAAVADWTWKPVRKPSLSYLSRRGQDWELTRYQAYQAQLARRPIGDTFRRAAGFLRAAAAGQLPSFSPAIRDNR